MFFDYREKLQCLHTRLLLAYRPTADQVWVLCESCADRKIGEHVVPPAGASMLNDHGLMQIDAEAGNGSVCLIEQVGLGELAAFCEERVQQARASEAIDGGDRMVADDIRIMSVQFTANGERPYSSRPTGKDGEVSERRWRRDEQCQKRDERCQTKRERCQKKGNHC